MNSPRDNLVLLTQTLYDSIIEGDGKITPTVNALYEAMKVYADHHILKIYPLENYMHKHAEVWAQHDIKFPQET